MSEENCRIRVLDCHTANQIAAGEVVERPVSVVKELAENAIDAGATKITIRLFDAQCEKIKVTDNGGGMSPEELRLAVQRHATSKIRIATDLDRLATLGFRGEALPSIAAISKLTITSKRADSDLAYTLRVRDGKAGLPEADAAATGTTVLVEQLFYNAPARRKFLKSPRTELGLISELIGKLAIAHPHIAFTLINGNHRLVVTDGSGVLERAVLAVYGKDVVNDLLPLNGSGDDYKISGLIGKPTLNRSNRNCYHFFVNRRTVRSQELSQAVDNAYHTLLPAQRYPCVFLFLEAPADSIDVNVHPSKLEIKFRDSQAVRQALGGALKSSLLRNQAVLPHLTAKAQEPIPGLPVSRSILAYGGSLTQAAERRPLSGAALYKSLAKGDASAFIGGQVMSLDEIEKLLEAAESREKSPATLGAGPKSGEKAPADLPGLAVQTNLEDDFGLPPAIARALALASDSQPNTEQPPADKTPEQKPYYFSRLQVLGQLAASFIVAAGDRALYLIDQHAAAERIAYERIAAQACQEDGGSALLALPLPIALSPQDSVLITDYLLQLRDLGFILEYFGDNSYVIRGVPAWYSGSDPEGLLRDLLALLHESGNPERLRQEALFMAACKQAVKANRYLTPQDIHALLADLDRCENPATCPHGRPIACILTLEEIRKRFLRNGI